MIAAMKPDLWVSLCDEVPVRVTSKRNRLSVDRTIKWLDECIALSPVGAFGFVSILFSGLNYTFNDSIFAHVQIY